MAIGLAALVVVFVGATPAHASSYVYSFIGVDYGFIDAGSDTDAWACMGNSNFHTVWTELEMTGFYSIYVYDYSPNGICSYAHVPPYILQFRFCVDTMGCTVWKPAIPGS